MNIERELKQVGSVALAGIAAVAFFKVGSGIESAAIESKDPLPLATATATLTAPEFLGTAGPYLFPALTALAQNRTPFARSNPDIIVINPPESRSNPVVVVIPQPVPQPIPQSTPETRFIPVVITATPDPNTFTLTKQELNHLVDQGADIRMTAEAKRIGSSTPITVPVYIPVREPTPAPVSQENGFPWGHVLISGLVGMAVGVAIKEREAVDAWAHRVHNHYFHHTD